MIKPLLSAEWLTRFSRLNQLIVGFSGGLDSTVLLHVLASHPILFSKLIPVHVNHGISPNASVWQEQCEHFCRNLDVVLITKQVEFDRSANVEEGARIARYGVFSSLMTEQSGLILGHHLDDQAETVLLQLFRGAGVDGLAAMSEFGPFANGALARPFLSCSREQLEHYAVLHQLSWIEDESNLDVSYARNYLRQQVMPLLRSKWQGVAGTIARTATHCQQAKRNLDALAVHDMFLEEASETVTEPFLFIAQLQKLSFDRIANVLRVWLKNNQIQLPSTRTFQRLIEEVIFARTDATPEVRCGEVCVRRYQKYLYVDKINSSDFPSSIEWSEFPSPIVLNDAGTHLLAKRANQGLIIPPKTKINVTFRKGGEELVLHGQTKRLKKLFQEWGIPPWLRESIPLIYFNDTLAAVVGYAVSDLFFIKDAADAWVLSLNSGKDSNSYR
ncbi:MAG: tRNA lysidine(34) synthetase TilS [Legionella sp.]